MKKNIHHDPVMCSARSTLHFQISSFQTRGACMIRLTLKLFPYPSIDFLLALTPLNSLPPVTRMKAKPTPDINVFGGKEKPLFSSAECSFDAWPFFPAHHLGIQWVEQPPALQMRTTTTSFVCKIQCIYSRTWR